MSDKSIIRTIVSPLKKGQDPLSIEISKLIFEIKRTKYSCSNLFKSCIELFDDIDNNEDFLIKFKDFMFRIDILFQIKRDYNHIIIKQQVIKRFIRINSERLISHLFILDHSMKKFIQLTYKYGITNIKDQIIIPVYHDDEELFSIKQKQKELLYFYFKDIDNEFIKNHLFYINSCFINVEKFIDDKISNYREGKFDEEFFKILDDLIDEENPDQFKTQMFNCFKRYFENENISINQYYDIVDELKIIENFLKKTNNMLRIREIIGDQLDFEKLLDFCDQRLKDGTIYEYDLDKITFLIDNLIEKDRFFLEYKLRFVQRLFTKQVQNIHDEKHLMSSFKEKFIVLSSDLLKMFGDLDANEDLFEIRNKYFKPLVLTYAVWPHFDTLNCNIPKPFSDLYHELLMQYYSIQKNKVLTICNVQKAVELQANCKSKIKFQASHLQACICLAFNESSQFSRDELIHYLNIDESTFKIAMAPLCHTKINIIKYDKKEDIYSFNSSLTKKNKKINLPIVKIKVSEKKISEDRKFTVDAIIVRVMKARKSLDYQSLITEVIDQSKLFHPEIKLIKDRVENLIDREYLSRWEEGSGFNYIS